MAKRIRLSDDQFEVIILALLNSKSEILRQYNPSYTLALNELWIRFDLFEREL